VTGRWAFTSGCLHSTWLTAILNAYDGDEARIDSNGKPEGRIIFLPASDYQIIDTWDVSGLRGSGSHDFVVSDKFVAEEYTLPRDKRLKILHPGQLYAFSAGVTAAGSTNSPWTGVASISTSALCVGVARGALDALLELAAVKTPRGGAGPLINNPVFHDQLARTEATLRAARAYLYETTREIWQWVATNGPCSPKEHNLLRLASVHAASLSADVVDMVWRAAGASAIFTANPFERRFRDIHAVTQNIAVRPDNYTLAGRVLLGVE
jgi:alkylation response protein AidB-like acyl-CoA dehydrogenase